MGELWVLPMTQLGCGADNYGHAPGSRLRLTTDLQPGEAGSIHLDSTRGTGDRMQCRGERVYLGP